MHLLVGFIVASLLGKKKKTERRSPLLSLRYPIRTRHILPGRVRFQADILKNDAKAEKFLGEQLKKVKGISEIRISTVTGSVLIHFSENKIQPELLYTVLIRLLGLEKELEKTPQPVILKEIRLIGDSINRAVLERSGGIIDLWTAIPIVLGAVGLRKIMAQRLLAFPTGFTLVWWSYQALFRQRSANK